MPVSVMNITDIAGLLLFSAVFGPALWCERRFQNALVAQLERHRRH